MAMKTSAAGRAAIMQREGVRLTAYRDTVGVLTIGVGHTGRATLPLVVPGMTITRDTADEILSRDLATFEDVVNAAAPRGLAQNAFDASVSLAFNIGASAFVKSTVARKIASGDMAGAADAFMMWVKPPELKARRESERAQFLKPDATGIAVDTDKPVLAGIEKALNAAAVSKGAVGAVVLPKPLLPVKAPQPAPVPVATPSFWARLKAAFTGKAA